ncbi:L-Ala-D/L-amino acid epimerase isoform X1 [Ziziphus jujuba]|uniref:Dipeptide epimerase n=3 Tax=Ziziphus jujuba TaxID=326968 RepID=A0ABM3II58_ZIZJJ|nr:L-Ala-D/L-amino acid epimerase isoform X1 [Ziziphus jujuba]KAH7533934.1 hypothetical protein FEM48_Zijuj04G0184200 [Ziziphus jujuba var. spinosa]
MALLGSVLCPSTSLFSSHPKQKPLRSSRPRKPFLMTCVCASSNGSNLMAVSEVSTDETTSFGFKNLTQTFWVDVQRAQEKPLNVKLGEPINIGSSRIEMVENVAIRVELSNGCVGWGEAAVTVKPRAMALAKAKEVSEFLRRSSPMTLNLVLEEISGILHGQEFVSVRAGFEMALIDAVANSIDVPLWRLFGGVSNSLTTAVTVPYVSPPEALKFASKFCEKGFNTMRFRMGENLNSDLEVIKAIRVVHPHCSFILDANEKFTSKEAIIVLEKLHDMNVSPVLFEQPVHRDDWNGLADVSGIARDQFGVTVVADESCQTLKDIEKIVQENITDGINIKLAKFGVLGVLQIVEVGRRSGLNLVIDSMVETRLGTGFAGHLAAGLGCFKHVNLDAPFKLSEDPVFGGYEASGPVYNFTNSRGQGGFLKWDIIAW